MPRTDILDRKEDILQWISENRSNAFMCRELSCKPETLKSYFKKMGISYKGNQGLKGVALADKNLHTYIPAMEYIESGRIISSHNLKTKLIRDGIKQSCCEICGASEWFGKKLPLELHHIDGDHYNNQLENLQILCPNCHAIQNGNAGSNIGRYNLGE